MPGTPGARTGLASVLTGDGATAFRSTINAVISWLEANAMLTSAGVLSARPVSTPGSPGIAGRRYYATDTGVEYRDTGTSWIALGVELVTSLPASPFNGQIIDLLTDATNGIVHRLRYRAASASAYKWESVGDASELRNTQIGQQDVTTVAALGAAITLPLAGDYDVFAYANAYNNTNGAYGYLWANTSSAEPANPAGLANPASVNGIVHRLVYEGRITGAAAGATLQLYGRGGAGAEPTGQVRFTARSLRVRPVRVG